MNSPLVSIIIRTKDRPKLLERALKSIAVQTYRPVEVVLVNDGGCNLDIEKLKFILADVSLNYVRLTKNVGRARAGNIGIKNAEGEYIGFLDDDDEYYPHHISTILNPLITMTDYSGAYTDSETLVRTYDIDGNIVAEQNEGVFKTWDFSHEILLFQNYIPLICAIARKEVLIEINGFDDSFEMFEDWDLFLRATEQKPFFHIREVTTKYIQWSKFHQIAFINSPNAEEFYLKVLSKHSSKITPKAAYKYFLVKQEEIVDTRNMQQDELIRLREMHEEKNALVSEVQAENTNLEYKVKEAAAESSGFQERLIAAEAESKGIRERLIAAEAESKGIREELIAAEAENKGIGERLIALESKNEEFKEKVAGMQSLIDELSSKNIHIEYQARHMKELQEKLTDKQTQVQWLREDIKDKQAQIQWLQGDIKDKQAQIQWLQDEFKDEHRRVRSLQEELKSNHIQVMRLQDEVKEQHALTQRLQAEKNAEGQILQEELRNRQNQIQSMREDIVKKTSYIEEVNSSVGWTVLMYYRNFIKEKLFPKGTKRRNFYENLLKRFKPLRQERPKSRNSLTGKQKSFVIDELDDIQVHKLDASVSVVIPTRNAGSDFHQVLEKIKRQKGIRDIEIIIADSGSEDDTLSLAKRYRAQILSIHPSEFGHGRTRNIGARRASGEYTMFLSQDAIPIGDTCFADMIGIMKNDTKIAAVSARQIPRSDADLFACWQIWNHYEKFLKYSDDNIVSVNHREFDLLGPDDKRRVAQIDNIFSCVRGDVFKRFMFNDLEYAEDLDLGLRLIKEGYKIGFLSSVGAIHSHNRNPVYHFKRSCVDRKLLINLLGYELVDWHAVGIDSFPKMLSYIRATYNKLDHTLCALEINSMKTSDIPTLFNSLHQLVRVNSSPRDGASSSDGLHAAIDELISVIGVHSGHTAIRDDILLRQFFLTLESFKEYICLYGAIDNRSEEIVSALYKVAAVVMGANLGDYMLFHEIRNGENIMVKLNSVFGKGV